MTERQNNWSLGKSYLNPQGVPLVPVSIYYDSNAVLPLVKLSIYDPFMVEMGLLWPVEQQTRI